MTHACHFVPSESFRDSFSSVHIIHKMHDKESACMYEYTNIEF